MIRILISYCFIISFQAQAENRVRLDDLGGLHIDRTEVTISQFEQFAKTSGIKTRAETEGGGFEYVSGWQRRPGWTWRTPEGMPANPELPAVHLTHSEATSYCRWAGGRLPTASEWRQAAFTELRAVTPAPWLRGKTYAWHTGDSPTGANTSEPDPWPNAAPVTQTRAGVNGLHDMGGNVWEWSSDARGKERRTLGGSWWYPSWQMKADVEAWKPADFFAVYIGFRCVYPASGLK